MNPVADTRLIWEYVRQLRALRPTAYCGFTIKPNVYGAIAARLTGTPAINNVTGLGTGFLSRGLTWGLLRRLYRFALSRSAAVFFHNRDDLELMVGSGIVSPSQAKVIPGSGIDLERFQPMAGRTEGAITFLFIGRLLAHKGIGEFVAAARLLNARMPNARFQLLGNLDPGNPSSVSAAQLATWISEGVVEHLGEREDVRPAIAAATAVVLPSYREGMSRALLEGAAMGKPLVGADVPGSRELIEEGVTGALCRVRDPQSLADAMTRIARATDSERAAMGRNARQKVEREFSEDIVVQAYLDVLANLAVERR
jgi:glycosyltransferase involved in cell wall biosynthesis